MLTVCGAVPVRQVAERPRVDYRANLGDHGSAVERERRLSRKFLVAVDSFGVNGGSNPRDKQKR